MATRPKYMPIPVPKSMMRRKPKQVLVGDFAAMNTLSSMRRAYESYDMSLEDIHSEAVRAHLG